ncbi:septum formation initiator family protein [Streptomyces sp. MP131-18]|uniref:FtsB family cell division protein n=1 Tax=Streptomyces sp. MP131-18 TaxID=1857892 RepID=UPI00097BB0E2|nr:septum formation initiator family protein [Streptomyces sp. MP131-18]ONK15021.1 Beta antigen [Streptomyces sp. MP131-18]
MSRSQRPPAAGAPGRLARLTGLGPARGSSAARTPFVLLVVVLLGAGMLGLLFLNASLNQGSFELSELRREQKELTDQQQQLQAEVDGYSAPDALAERARELGLVPGGPPAFIDPDGSVLGDAEPAPAPSPEAEETEDGGTEIPEGPVAPQSGPADGPAPTPEPALTPEEPGAPSGTGAPQAPGAYVAPEPGHAPEPTPAPTAPADGTDEPVTPPAPPAPGPGEIP